MYLPEVLSDRSESRVAGEGDRRRQLAPVGPVGTRSWRSGDRLLVRPRQDARGTAGGDLDLREGNGDRTRGTGRWRSYGDRDLLLVSSFLGGIGRTLRSSSLLGENLRGGANKRIRMIDKM
jgi:hypothetical protein